MKKIFLFLIALIAAYFIYQNFFGKKELVEIDGSLVRVQESASLESPGVSARNFGHAEGTIKNVSDKMIKNITITYMIDRQQSSITINKLSPQEKVSFKTKPVLIRVLEPPFYLENVKYE